ncbi:MAG: RNA polymerase sigma factor [Planctomycetota bacterium]|nr:RNA polymerase sigma factor [Planctomycetota bacterium]
MPVSDEELLQRAKQRDEDALSELLLRHGPIISQRIGPRIGQQWRAMIAPEDVMQVTYLEAFLRIERVQAKDVAQFIAWLTKVADNNLRDAIRVLEADKRPQPNRRLASSRRQHDSSIGLLEMLAVASQTPSRVVATDEALKFLHRALDQLPPDYARVVREYDLENRPVEEVAANLQRSPGAVYMLRARAHECLQELMGNPGQFFSQG